jgi:hypothetical protein
MKNSRSNLMIYAQQLICIGGLRRQSLFLCHEVCFDYRLSIYWVFLGNNMGINIDRIQKNGVGKGSWYSL